MSIGQRRKTVERRVPFREPAGTSSRTGAPFHLSNAAIRRILGDVANDEECGQRSSDEH
jgi:hypothetical protein